MRAAAATANTSWAAYRLLLVQPYLIRRNVGQHWGLGLVALLAVAPTVMVLLLGGGREELSRAALLPSMMLLLACWMMLVRSAVSANTPANAQLVPRLRKRLCAMVAWTWLVLALITSAIYTVTFGNVLTAFAICGFVLATSASLTRAVTANVAAITIVSVLAATGPGRSALSLVAVAMGSTGGALLGVMLMLAHAAWVLRTLLPAGGDGHWRSQACVERLLRGTANNSSAPHIVSRSSITWQAVQALLPYRPQSKPAALLLGALGPASHPALLALPVAAALSLIPLANWFFRGAPPSDPEAAANVAMLATTFAVLIGACVQGYVISASINETRREQALVRLAPRIPQGATMNVMLARGLLLRYLVAWGMMTASAAGLVLTVAPMEAAVMMVSAACAALLPAGAVVRADTAALASGLRAAVLLALVLAFAGLRGYVVALPWPLFGVACLLVAAYSARRNWQQILAQPGLFPIGGTR